MVCLLPPVFAKHTIIAKNEVVFSLPAFLPGFLPAANNEPVQTQYLCDVFHFVCK